MKIPEVPVCAKKQACRGMTLIEVIVAMIVLSILAILAVNALFYPRYLVVTSSLEQSAIHAATAEIERHLNNYTSPVERKIFNTDGWTPVSITTATNIVIDPIDTTSDNAQYLKIETTVEYRDGKILNLITYRSLEVPSSKR